MNQDHLRALLDQLHQELAANPPTDENSRSQLLELQRDIERVLFPVTATGELSTTPSEPQNLRERLREVITGFEGTHPQSAAALERVMVLLSNFGL